MIDDWQPISAEELRLRVDEERRQLSDREQQTFDEWKVPLGTRGKVAHFSTDGVEVVFIIARRNSIVVFFDDVEDEFATGVIDSDDNITEAGLCGDLCDAVRNVEIRTA